MEFEEALAFVKNNPGTCLVRNENKGFTIKYPGGNTDIDGKRCNERVDFLAKENTKLSLKIKQLEKYKHSSSGYKQQVEALLVEVDRYKYKLSILEKKLELLTKEEWINIEHKAKNKDREQTLAQVRSGNMSLPNLYKLISREFNDNSDTIYTETDRELIEELIEKRTAKIKDRSRAKLENAMIVYSSTDWQ